MRKLVSIGFVDKSKDKCIVCNTSGGKQAYVCVGEITTSYWCSDCFELCVEISCIPYNPYVSPALAFKDVVGSCYEDGHNPVKRLQDIVDEAVKEKRKELDALLEYQKRITRPSRDGTKG